MPRPQSPLTKLILSLPTDLAAAEVVERAKAAGFATNPENVTQVRSRARAAAKTAKKSVAPKAATAVASAPAATKPAAKKIATKAAKTKTASEFAGSSGGRPAAHAGRSRSEFIRSLPATMPVNDVVAKAKAEGIELRAHLVYEVRRADRLREAPARKKASSKPTTSSAHAPAPTKVAVPNAHAKPVPAETTAHGHISPEDLLRAVAAEVGLARAISVLEEQRRHVLHVLAR